MSGNVTVITQSQLDSIRAQISDPQPTLAKTDRARRKELSTTRASKWPNTIEAQRARKETLRIQEMEKAEALRVKEDERQARIKAEERRVQIERANKMLYDQTDRVKAFHGTLLRSDVMLENEKQIEFKRHISGLQKKLDGEFLVQQKEALEIAEQAELRKMEERKLAALEQKKTQLEQLEEVRAKLLAERQQRMLDGQRLLEAAEREKQKEIEAAIRAREEAQLRNLEMLKANDALKEYRRVQAERDRQAEEQIAAYAAQKAAMIEERKRREIQYQEQKEQKRQAMIDYMEENIEKERKKNEKLMKIREDNYEQKRAADLAERQREAFEMQSAIDASRSQQLAMRQARKDREKAEEEEFTAAWSQRLQELQQEDEAEKAELMNRHKHNQALLVRQIEQKSRKKMGQKQQALEEAFISRLALEEEDQMFDEYTTVCMDEWAGQGKDIRPMAIHLTHEKAKMATGIMPAITNSFR
mmetsp:Transcript_10473/g.29777  ORF Transcript_10473/g.29777 Transcript_10473/m.29777 type:complete len:474 (-) Transcript_10473:192-1613(-)